MGRAVVVHGSGRPCDADVAGDGLRPDLDERTVAGGSVGRQLELGARVPADRVAVEIDLRAAADADRDVAGDRGRVDLTTHDGAVLLIAADRVCADVVVGLADREVARGRRDADRAADDVELDVAGSGLRADAAADLADADIAARALDVDAALDHQSLDVAGGRADVQVADRAADPHVRRLRPHGEQRALWAADAAADPGAAEDEREAEAPALVRNVDDQLRAAVVLVQLDTRLVDEPLRLLVVRDELHLDATVQCRVDLDLAGGEAHVDLRGAADVECLLHGVSPNSGRSRTGACR